MKKRIEDRDPYLKREPCLRQVFVSVALAEGFVAFMERHGIGLYRVDPDPCPCGKVHVLREELNCF
jgi:hypothetical protein